MLVVRRHADAHADDGEVEVRENARRLLGGRCAGKADGQEQDR